MRLEHRAFTFELRSVADGEDGARTFEGYGSVFNTVDAYSDTIVKGAYKQTLKEWKARKKLPKMLLQHGGGGFFSANADDMVPIGKWEEMREDDYGLFMRGRLFDVDTDRAKATYAALKEGELDGLSIGFRTRKSKMDEDTGVRTLTEIELYEVSLVTFPANDPARVTGVKASDMTERQFEEFLRDAGFPIAAAKTIVAKGYRALRDAAGGNGNPEPAATAELIAAIRQYGSLATGEQR